MTADRMSPLAIFSLCAGLLATPASAEESIGSATTPDGKVKVDITSLKRTEGETVTMKVTVTNNSNDRFSMTIENAKLIDIVGRRTYGPGLVSPSCSAPVGQTANCYAIFGAPPAGTKKINVQFYERFDLIGGVPISE